MYVNMISSFKQELDSKTISRLEKAIAKSEFSQGKTLKVNATVCFIAIEDYLDYSGHFY